MTQGTIDPIMGKERCVGIGFYEGSLVDLAEWRDSHNVDDWHDIEKAQNWCLLHRKGC